MSVVCDVALAIPVLFSNAIVATKRLAARNNAIVNSTVGLHSSDWICFSASSKLSQNVTSSRSALLFCPPPVVLLLKVTSLLLPTPSC